MKCLQGGSSLLPGSLLQGWFAVVNGPLPAASGGWGFTVEQFSAGSYCHGKRGAEWKRMGRTHIKRRKTWAEEGGRCDEPTDHLRDGTHVMWGGVAPPNPRTNENLNMRTCLGLKETLLCIFVIFILHRALLIIYNHRWWEAEEHPSGQRRGTWRQERWRLSSSAESGNYTALPIL